MTTAAIELTGVTKRYGLNTALDDVHLSVPAGGVYGLVGPNGAGKTTLLSIVGGLRRPDSGTVSLGVPRESMALVPDVPGFEPWLTADEVLTLARSLANQQPSTVRVQEALDRVGLNGVGSRRVGGFSRGMTQRLGLATALVTDARLVVLDEPVSALDPAGRADVLHLIAELAEHATVVFSSHILGDVQRVADRVAIIDRGRVLHDGVLRELLEERVRPQWRIRTPDADAARSALVGLPWVVEVGADGRDVEVRTTTFDDGERGLVAALGTAGVPVSALEPVAADLEAIFLEITDRRGAPA